MKKTQLCLTDIRSLDGVASKCVVPNCLRIHPSKAAKGSLSKASAIALVDKWVTSTPTHDSIINAIKADDRFV